MSKLLAVYLVAYYLTVAGALLTLWRIGALQRAPQSWSYGGIAIALFAGVLLALTTRRRGRRPPVPPDERSTAAPPRSEF